MNRPFLDAQGKRGKPRLTSRAVNRTNDGKGIRFRLFNSTHITVEYPGCAKAIPVNKKDGIRLAHWLLDECSK